MTASLETPRVEVAPDLLDPDLAYVRMRFESREAPYAGIGGAALHFDSIEVEHDIEYTPVDEIARNWTHASRVDTTVIERLTPAALIEGRRAYLEALYGLDRDSLKHLPTTDVNNAYFSATLHNE